MLSTEAVPVAHIDIAWENDLAVLVTYTPAVLLVASRLVRSPWRNITVACDCKLAWVATP